MMLCELVSSVRPALVAIDGKSRPGACEASGRGALRVADRGIQVQRLMGLKNSTFRRERNSRRPFITHQFRNVWRKVADLARKCLSKY